MGCSTRFIEMIVMIKCFWWRWWSWKSPAGHRVRAGDSKRRMYSCFGKRKPRPLQSSSHELRHLWISHKNYHSRGKKLIKSQTTGEGPLSSDLFFLPKVPLLPWVRLHYQPSFSLDQTVDIFEKDTRKEVSLVFHSTLLKYHQIATFNQISKNRLETTPWKESRFPKTQQSSWPVSLSRRMR